MSTSSPTAEPAAATGAAPRAARREGGVVPFVPPPLRGRARLERRTAIGGHSVRVRFLRRALPIATGLLLLLLLGWVGARSMLASIGAGRATITTVHMSHPHFYGRDSSGRPFSLTAQSATRDGKDAATIVMDRPVFMLQTGAPKPTVMQSLTGTYREDAKSLLLAGQVRLEDGAGYRFDTDRALIDTVTGVATGQTGVAGAGPLGQVTSSAYAVYDGGAHVIFKGDVRLHLNPTEPHPKPR